MPRERTGRREAPKRAAEILCDELELPGIGSHIEILGSREAIVEGCKGVLRCEEDIVKLNLGRGTVSLSGGELCIRTFRCEQVVICGKIASITFE